MFTATWAEALVQLVSFGIHIHSLNLVRLGITQFYKVNKFATTKASKGEKVAETHYANQMPLTFYESM